MLFFSWEYIHFLFLQEILIEGLPLIFYVVPNNQKFFNEKTMPTPPAKHNNYERNNMFPSGKNINMLTHVLLKPTFTSVRVTKYFFPESIFPRWFKKWNIDN